MVFYAASCPVNKSVHVDERVYSSGYYRRGGFRSQETSHSSFYNRVESVGGDGRSGYRSHTRPSTSHNTCGLDRSSSLSIYGHKVGGNRSHKFHLPPHNHGGLHILNPIFPQDTIHRDVRGEKTQKVIKDVYYIQIKTTLIILIQS